MSYDKSTLTYIKRVKIGGFFLAFIFSYLITYPPSKENKQ